MARKSLVDELNVLIMSKPDFGSDEEEDTKAKIVEPYNENDDSNDKLQISKIRKQNVDTLDKVDKRYTGKKISRKDIYSDEGDSTNEDAKSKCSEEEEINDIMEQNEDELYREANLIEGSTNTFVNMSDLKDQNYYDIGINTNDPFYKQINSNIKTMFETNVDTEIEKGNCVRNQLKLWENFLEIRIKLQKCLVISNQMPQHDVHKELGSDMNFVKKVNETKMKLALIMENMLRLKDLLLKQYPETKNFCTDVKKIKIDKNKNINTNDSLDKEISSDTEDELENGKQLSIDKNTKTIEELVPQKRLKYNDYEKILQKDHDSYRKYRDSVIKKWNDKTRFAIGSLNKGSSQTTLKQIEFAMSDISKLRNRTQLKRSEYNVVGKCLLNGDNDGRRIQEYDPEIYDDDDFYHQLLRDLIEYRSSDMTDPVQLSKQWIQLQNMRKKMKRKIDTRATKGRRVRYNVHNKLINFMAPITVYDTWTDNAKNELYNSLFGKIKSTEEQIK
ncbi:PREDICTED: protein AATF-like [Acromyrmex echinatior]|uniref:Protein AATF n=1 Tax=Acromyrmex echinatior TaxID=103372 RepID=F4X4I2_ACREC|nr:PREDICTED: protein AATF-like [Acromyrmex echinatior]XP_011065441.1 PREDICTED: protein AATF-like [Acromyrmex echinatior]EGI58641.1 Protein AATF [Acromyrmex echinatior]EGI58642.1 Protein AATF [Acromyrmex echinatior]